MLKTLHRQSVSIIFSIVVAVLISTSMWFWYARTVDGSEFEPLYLHTIRTPNVIEVGEHARITNGICNQTDEGVSAQMRLQAQETTTEEVVVLRPRDDARVHETILVPAGECVGEVVYDDIVEAGALPPGRWVLGIHVTVIGSGNQRQVLEKVSDPFLLVDHR